MDIYRFFGWSRSLSDQIHKLVLKGNLSALKKLRDKSHDRQNLNFVDELNSGLMTLLHKTPYDSEVKNWNKLAEESQRKFIQYLDSDDKMFCSCAINQYACFLTDRNSNYANITSIDYLLVISEKSTFPDVRELARECIQSLIIHRCVRQRISELDQVPKWLVDLMIEVVKSSIRPGYNFFDDIKYLIDALGTSGEGTAIDPILEVIQSESYVSRWKGPIRALRKITLAIKSTEVIDKVGVFLHEKLKYVISLRKEQNKGDGIHVEFDLLHAISSIAYRPASETVIDWLFFDFGYWHHYLRSNRFENGTWLSPLFGDYTPIIMEIVGLNEEVLNMVSNKVIMKQKYLVRPAPISKLAHIRTDISNNILIKATTVADRNLVHDVVHESDDFSYPVYTVGDFSLVREQANEELNNRNAPRYNELAFFNQTSWNLQS